MLGGGGEKSAHRVLLMTASSQRGGILERHYVFGPMDMQAAAYQYGFFSSFSQLTATIAPLGTAPGTVMPVGPA